jgi:ParB family chromosome partitioning protein
MVVRPLDGGRRTLARPDRRARTHSGGGSRRPDEVSGDVPDREHQRENLNPLEEATALRRLIDDFSMTHQEAADAVGRSRAAVSNLLRLLELMQEVKDMIDMRLIEMGHARALLSLDDDLQVQGAREVVRKRLSVRDTENLVRRLRRRNRRTAPRHWTSCACRTGREAPRAHPAPSSGKQLVIHNSADES